MATPARRPRVLPSARNGDGSTVSAVSMPAGLEIGRDEARATGRWRNCRACQTTKQIPGELDLSACEQGSTRLDMTRGTAPTTFSSSQNPVDSERGGQQLTHWNVAARQAVALR